MPGANSIAELWSLLSQGGCAISSVPSDRFNLDHYGHPRLQERGRSFTWAAGVIDDVFGFDPLAFGISPREAPQLDPQQRLLLKLTWEALEDAGVAPSSLAGTEVGVYVGASLTEYAHNFFGDPSAADAHFATGNALAVIANRISYIFDFRGPSITYDTACSSSLVALNAACEALDSGRIDVAVVAGVNIIAAPTSFISFSQASMLSPTGLCRAFSTGADGFVRAEGGAVLVLKRADVAREDGQSWRGHIIASDVNSDGRTNGISLPSGDAQESLLRSLYNSAGVDPDQLAFVEAHGTGTAAGDPIEAGAIGRSLGQHRTRSALTIGSIKTNVGHLEAASGIAGVVKAMLALAQRTLPPVVNYLAPNADIDFTTLNLEVCTSAQPLQNADEKYAGVNSFGFGGTNAHAIIAGPDFTSSHKPGVADGARLFVLSAHSKPALNALAGAYRGQILGLPSADTARVAAAALHRRDLLPHRLAIASDQTAVVAAALDAAAEDLPHAALTMDHAGGALLPVAFVFSGNGSQWAGMGRKAYRLNERFRERFSEIDGLFKPLSGWSLAERLFAADLDKKIALTSVAQPLIFAIQSSITAALRDLGIRAIAAVGHSVGEVAAAEASGALSLPEATRVIHFRSLAQEGVRNLGRMAAVLGSQSVVRPLLNSIEGIEIAAYNSPQAVTVAGPSAQIAAFLRLARQRGIAALDLDLEYPFHTSLMDPIQAGLESDLADLVCSTPNIAFVSTVIGEHTDAPLDANYWWRNVREPVRFSAAIAAAAALGARVFVEIGPRGMLSKHVLSSLPDGQERHYLSALDLDQADDVDPLLRLAAKLLAKGAQIEIAAIAGTDGQGDMALPLYPWQQQQYRVQPTSENIGWSTEASHPLSGARLSQDVLQWVSLIDTERHPFLSGHRLGSQTILPGTGFIDIFLDVGRHWLDTDDLRISDFELLRPLDISNGEIREVITRISPGTHLVEVLSRPRLSNANLVLHVRGRVSKGALKQVSTEAWPSIGRVIDADQHYRTADGSGLHYDGTFREVERVTVHDKSHITVYLPEGALAEQFWLDPSRLDCCAQGVISLFPELHAEERGVAFIPVRIDEINLLQPRALIRKAQITVRSRSERTIFVDLEIFAGHDVPVATLIGVRCQAVPVRRPTTLQNVSFIERVEPLDGTWTGVSGVLVTVDDIVDEVCSAAQVETSEASEEGLALLEGWATVASYEIASALAAGRPMDIDLLVSRKRWPAELKVWLKRALTALQAAGLCSFEKGQWTMLGQDLPTAGSILASFIKEHPELAGEILVAAELNTLASRLAGGAGASGVRPLSALSYDFHARHNPHGQHLSDLLKLIRRRAGKNQVLRVLQIGSSERLRVLDGVDTHLSIYEPEYRRREDVAASFGRSHAATLLEDFPAPESRFDVILADDGLKRLPAQIGPEDIGALLAPDGLLLAVDPPGSLFHDMAFHFAALSESETRQRSFRPVVEGTSWLKALQAGAFAQSRIIEFRGVTLLVAKALSTADGGPVPDALADDRPAVLVIDPNERHKTELPVLLERQLGEAGIAVVFGIGSLGEKLPAAAGDALILLSSVENEFANDLARLRKWCLDQKSCAVRLGATPSRLFFVTEGALASDHGAIKPLATAQWAFARTLANEFPNVHVCKIDVVESCPAALVAQRIVAIMTSGTEETEFQIDETSVRAVRVRSAGIVMDQVPFEPATAVRLERKHSVHERVEWLASERSRPGPQEIEIEVGASGLNFRDLMFSMGLLPDDMLEDGLTGATLGLECAGRVADVGAGVSEFRKGDRVVAFAKSSFSSFVTVPVAQCARIPERISTTAAATIPVAFLTAWYGLETLARLEADEWVLIHGAAGAVGLAAIQIAQERKAHIIATAGSDAKRALIHALGVDHVLDSRTLDFADQVRKFAPRGVDVVLNSLAGEAMERGVACLAPFGRFVELGKRDYVANTSLGLRPFRKNLSYFGVDLDQLMSARPALARKLFGELMAKFEKGVFHPSPFSLFAGEDVLAAFTLMQQSGHIGKIVVQPAKPGLIRARQPSFRVNSAKSHLVTGAFSGLGMETARWLVDRGAEHLVLVGRSSASTDQAKNFVEELKARGVHVMAESCDVADADAVEKLFVEIDRKMPPLAGLVHSAMVLDDSTIANMDVHQLNRVLAPKVSGASHLDRITRRLKLDYFVLYSSVTTMIGNPGQGAYVAANAFMEGVSRRRRQKGLPSLAIGWGPIADVGVVARSKRLKGDLQKVGGVRGMMSREALDLMGDALAICGADPALAVITIATHEGAFNSDRLPVLKSPTFATLSNVSRVDSSVLEQVDLKSIVMQEELEVVRELVTRIVTKQLVSILQFQAEDIVPRKPLTEFGLDSLMSLELFLALEESFGLQLALAGTTAELTLAGLVDEIIDQANVDDDTVIDTATPSLAAHHTSHLNVEDVAAFTRSIGAVSRAEEKKLQ